MLRLFLKIVYVCNICQMIMRRTNYFLNKVISALKHIVTNLYFFPSIQGPSNLSLREFHTYHLSVLTYKYFLNYYFSFLSKYTQKIYLFFMKNILPNTPFVSADFPNQKQVSKVKQLYFDFRQNHVFYSFPFYYYFLENVS